MKPSEYLLKPNGKYNLFSYHNMNLIDNIDDYNNPKYSKQEYDDACKYKDKLLEDIDKRFIEREELKDKINKILNKFAKTTDIDGRETLYKYTDCDLADLRAEILELLEE